jgi:RNA polymerase sigma-70 factor (ECF subfamily)
MESEPAQCEDLTLIRRYVDGGDAEALGAFFDRHSGFAYRLAYGVLRDGHEAEDAVQAAFLEMMNTLKKHRGGEGVRAWVAQVVMGTCKMKIRQSVRRRARERRAAAEQDATSGGAEGSAREADLIELVRRAMEGIPEHYRLPVWMHHYEGMSFGEVGMALSVPEGRARTYASRGVEMLRRDLARAGASVAAVSIVQSLSAIPVEAAPLSLVEGLKALAHGGGGAVAAGLPGGKGVAMGGMKLAVLATLIVGSGLIGTVWLMTKPHSGNVATQGVAAAQDGFSDDFETGLGKWTSVPANCDIAKGEGIGGSRCLRVKAGSATTDIPSLFVSPQENIEVSFQIRFESETANPTVAVGLSAGDREGGWHSYTPLVWLPIGQGGPSTRLLRGKWMHYRYVVRGKEVAATFSVGGKAYQWQSASSTDPKGRLISICVGALQGATIYIDDVLIRPLDSGPIGQ